MKDDRIILVVEDHPRAEELTLRALRATEATRVLPVVVPTSSNEEQDMVRSYRLGANSYSTPAGGRKT